MAELSPGLAAELRESPVLCCAVCWLRSHCHSHTFLGPLGSVLGPIAGEVCKVRAPQQHPYPCMGGSGYAGS